MRVNPWIYGRTTYAFAPAAAADSYGVLTVVWSDDVGDIRARRYFMPPAPNAETCTGDCDFNNVVTIDELVTGVRMSLDAEARGLGCCQAFDASMDSQVTVDEIVNAVRHALRGCPEN